MHPALFAVDDLVREIVEECGHTAPGRLHLEGIVQWEHTEIGSAPDRSYLICSPMP